MADAILAVELATPGGDALPQRSDASPPKTPIVPVPPNAPPMQFRHPKHGEPSASWPYQNTDGNLIGYVCRWNFEKSDGTPDKLILPVCYCDLGDGRRAWRSSGFPEPRPLYRLPDILARPDATVLVTEGEKACDAAAALFADFVATTPPHGAKSPQKTDWSSLRGRQVVIWPDHDEAGCNFAEAVATIAIEVGVTNVHIVNVPTEFPDKWDLADPLPEGWTRQHLENLLAVGRSITSDAVAGASDVKKAGSSAVFPFQLAKNTVEVCDEKDGEHEWRFLCSYLEVAATTRSASGEDWGRLLLVRDRDGTVHEWPMPMAMLAGGGEDYRRQLLSLGLEIAPGQKARNRLHEYVSTCRPDERAQCVNRIGWHGSTFVLPDETIGDAGDERILLQTEGRLTHAFNIEGTLADWQEHVAQYAAGNSRLVLAISAAFAGPLLNLIDAESGGFHLRGASSIGKTTALVLAGSVWGGGGVKGFIRQWRATDNGLEAVAQGHCDTLLCLDELSQIDAKAAGACAYMLANGAGKSRAGRGGEGRTPAQWRILFLSTGEIGIADKVAEDGRGKKVSAGQEVRVIDLPADAGTGLGLFEDLHGFESADAFARHLKQAADGYYGEAGRVFLSAITRKLDDAQEAVRGFVTEFVDENCPKNADGQVQRAAGRFALVAAAGEWAIKVGILPWHQGEAIEGVATCFHAWLEARGGIEPAEVTAAIAHVRHFIEQHGESRFAPWHGDDHRPTINRAGFRKTDGDGGTEYYVLPEVWKSEVCAGFDAGMVARALAERGLLIPDGSDGKPQSRHRLPGHNNPVRCYRLAPSILGGDDNA